MAIITAIYSFSLRLSLTPPLPRLVLVHDRLLFSLSVSHAHTHTHTHTYSLSLFLSCYSLLSPPPFHRSEQADALVWPASARLAVNESLNPLSSPPRLLSRCWPVSSKPRDLPSFECNVRHGCTQTKTPDLLLFPSVSLDLDRTPPIHVYRTHTCAREFQRRLPIPEGRAIPMRLQPPPPPPPPTPQRFDCCWPSTDARTDARVSVVWMCVYVCTRCVHATCLCVIGCVAIVNEIVRSYAGGTRVVFIGWRLIVMNNDEWRGRRRELSGLFHRYSRWKVEHDESGMELQFS